MQIAFVAYNKILEILFFLEQFASLLRMRKDDREKGFPPLLRISETPDN